MNSKYKSPQGAIMNFQANRMHMNKRLDRELYLPGPADYNDSENKIV